MQAVQIGPLSAVIVPPGPDMSIERDVVLLHGYGAPGTDLVGLSGQLSPPPGTRFIFPQAPHVLPGMSGPHAGRAWWGIDMMALQIARMTGQDDQLAAAVPEGLVDARAQLEAGLLALEENHGLRFERTFVGGFSQGAMLSCDWVLHSGRELAGLIQLSGTVICEAQWRQSLPKRAGLRVFQSHSPDDQVLPFSLAQRLARAMREAGLQHEFVSFRGGHGIGPDVSLALSRFLDS